MLPSCRRTSSALCGAILDSRALTRASQRPAVPSARASNNKASACLQLSVRAEREGRPDDELGLVRSQGEHGPRLLYGLGRLASLGQFERSSGALEDPGLANKALQLRQRIIRGIELAPLAVLLDHDMPSASFEIDPWIAAQKGVAPDMIVAFR